MPTNMQNAEKIPYPCLHKEFKKGMIVLTSMLVSALIGLVIFVGLPGYAMVKSIVVKEQDKK